jgi:glycosyltransferase involved in cell wall biosynthesis
VSPNWAPSGLAAQPNLAVDNLRVSWGLVGKFVVMYSGNLGRVHDLNSIISIAEQLRTESDVVFLFVGEGAQKKKLQTIARRRGLKNIQFRPAMPRHDLGKTLALANVHLVTLRKGCEPFVFPSKFYGIAAVGRPVLFIGPRNCELAHTVTNQGFGLVFAHDDIASATAVIRELRNRPDRCLAMGKSAVAFYARSGGLEKSAATWGSMLSGMKPLADYHSAQPKSRQ